MRSILASTLPHLRTLVALPSEVSETRYFTSGEVHIEPGAGIGAGVLLRANPGCRIEIRRGACIGMGSILHAQGGSLIIEAGATLGTGVLVIGQGTIGSYACVGSESTLINCSVLSHQVIPPGSLLGDPSYTGTPSPAAPAPPATETPPPDAPASPLEAQIPHHQTSTPPAEAQIRPSRNRRLNGIPGHSELDRLLGKIYPHRQILFSRDG